MNPIIKKILIYTVIVIICVPAFLFLVGKYGPGLLISWEKHNQQKIYDQMMANRQALETARDNDVIGGKTPEETLALYMQALKENNPEKAGSYVEISRYNPDSRQKAIQDFKGEIKEKGDLNRTLIYTQEVIKNGTTKYFDGLNGEKQYYVSYKKITTSTTTTTNILSGEKINLTTPPGVEEEHGVGLIKMSKSGVWKIINE